MIKVKYKIIKIIGVTSTLICLTLATYMIYTRIYYRKINQINTNEFITKLTIVNNEPSIKSPPIIDTRNIHIEEDLEPVVSKEIKGIALMNIESCGIETIITEGIGGEQLKYSIGHFPDTPLPSEGGNFAVAGHSSVLYDRVLNGIENIELGAKITITTEQDIYEYYVSDKFVVAPTATFVLNNTDNSQITIVTCTESGTKRLIIIAETKELIDEPVEHKSMFSLVYEKIKENSVPLNKMEHKTINLRGRDYKKQKEVGTLTRNKEYINSRVFKKLGQERNYLLTKEDIK